MPCNGCAKCNHTGTITTHTNCGYCHGRGHMPYDDDGRHGPSGVMACVACRGGKYITATSPCQG